MVARYLVEKAINRNKTLGDLYHRWETEYTPDNETFYMKLLWRGGVKDRMPHDEEMRLRVEITVTVDEILAFPTDADYLAWIETEYAIAKVTQ